MQIIAINGSPRGAAGNTEQLLQAFLKGAEGSGARAETIYLKDKTIKHCRGCYTCWGVTPGVCVHKDDMAELLEKLRYSDMIIYATPLYVYTVSGLMKDFMDRRLPLALPHIKKYGEQYAHPRRYEREAPQKTILISNCGFPSRQYFSGLLETFRIMCTSPHNELVGAIMCSAGPMLTIPPFKEKFRWYLDACETAGKEVVQKGGISAETQAVLERELITDVDQFMSMINRMWDKTLSGEIKFEPRP